MKGYYFIFILALTLLQSSCKIRNQVHDSNKILLDKNRIKAESKELRSDLAGQIRHKPNRKMLGIIKFHLWVYKIGTLGKENKIKWFLKNKIGEPPAYLDSSKMDATVSQMQRYLFNRGYFQSKVNYEVEVKTLLKRATVVYNVDLNSPAYKVNSIDYKVEDDKIKKILKDDKSNTLLSQWMTYDNNILVKEGERLTSLLRNHGYYFFSKDFIFFDIDSNYNNHSLAVTVNVVNPTSGQHQIYKVGQVTIEIDRSLSSGNKQLALADAKMIDGYEFISHGYKINPKFLIDAIQFHEGDTFKISTLRTTYSKLVEMQIFKFVNIQFLPLQDSAQQHLRCLILLSPQKRQEFVIEPQIITADQNNALTNQNFRNYGIANNFKYRNKNVFKNAEFFELTWRSAIEAQRAFSGERNYFISTEQSVIASIYTPKLLLLNKLDARPETSLSRTSFSLSFTYEDNVDFTRRVVGLGYTYQTKVKNTTFYLAPVEISYIQSNLKSAFLDSLGTQDGFFIRNLFSTNIITDSRFWLIYSNQSAKQRKKYIYFRLDALEWAGNLLTLGKRATNAPQNDEGQYTLFDINYFQYVKSAFDFRFNHIVDENNSYVLRLSAGVGLPYGNSSFLPFEKRFFIGGANSIRAWRPRTLGPGSFTDTGTVQIDRSGEIKIEANAEYRFDLVDQLLEGAVFIDAGNIWNLEDGENRQGASFKLNSFYKDAAIGTGVGLRFDFTFFLVRLDLGLRMRNPELPNSERWVIRDFGQRGWLTSNSILNLGIGYPF